MVKQILNHSLTYIDRVWKRKEFYYHQKSQNCSFRKWKPPSTTSLCPVKQNRIVKATCFAFNTTLVISVAYKVFRTCLASIDLRTQSQNIVSLIIVHFAYLEPVWIGLKQLKRAFAFQPFFFFHLYQVNFFFCSFTVVVTVHKQ